MAKYRTELFNRQLRAVTRPLLAELGFTFDGSRTFRRAVPDTDPTIVQIINFQLGQRSLEGRFTCNLGVYHPRYGALEAAVEPGRAREEDCAWELRQRLGFLRRRKSVLAVVWEGVFGPRDYWWRLPDAEAAMEKTLSIVTLEILGPGLEWLTAHSTEEACATAVRADGPARAHT